MTDFLTVWYLGNPWRFMLTTFALIGLVCYLVFRATRNDQVRSLTAILAFAAVAAIVFGSGNISSSLYRMERTPVVAMVKDANGAHIKYQVDGKAVTKYIYQPGIVTQTKASKGDHDYKTIVYNRPVLKSQYQRFAADIAPVDETDAPLQPLADQHILGRVEVTNYRTGN